MNPKIDKKYLEKNYVNKKDFDKYITKTRDQKITKKRRILIYLFPESIFVGFINMLKNS